LTWRTAAPIWLVALAGLLAAPAQARLQIDTAVDTDAADHEPGFTVAIDDEPLAAGIRAVFVMPGEQLRIAARDLPGAAELVLQTSGHGVIDAKGARHWQWRAPATPGLYPLAIYNRKQMSRLRLNVFVQRPFDASQHEIDGYRIGRYQPQGLRGRASSAPPEGLVEVTPANRDVRLSTHFTLGDFLCHQQPDHWPKYLRVRPRLLEKLERLHGALAEAGFGERAITVMSGYRTPWYNADIGNTTVYSQHLFGGAADIFVDGDDDNRMDDLNGDGAIDTADARWLADLVDTITAETPALAGGMSAYPANSRHGPFVHIDVRGMRVRW
jgi:hypothetical protein